MKRITLCRHAKLSWKYPVDDRYRPLNRRGLNDALSMATSATCAEPQLILCSPAVRIYATAIAYINEQNWSIERLQLVPDIYESNCQELIDCLANIDDQTDDVWLFGHNPSINSLIDYLLGAESGQTTEKSVVTGARIQIEMSIASWQYLRDASLMGDGTCRLIEWSVPVRK